MHLTRDTTVADEILQDTFIEVMINIRKFRGEAQLGTWIREIAVNKCLMHLRSDRGRKFKPLKAIEPYHRDQTVQDTVTDSMDLDKDQDKRRSKVQKRPVDKGRSVN